MKIPRKVKIILFALTYGINLFSGLCLWLSGISGNILLGILFFLFYRLSLWLSPAAVTLICWLPSAPIIPIRKKLLFNLAHLLFCGCLFLISYLLFGNWY